MRPVLTLRTPHSVCLLDDIADEAGQYLTAYRQSERRTLTLIYERLNEAPDALLRTTLTSIPCANRTDAETFRASFGVRALDHLLTTLSSDWKCSFAKIAQADTRLLYLA
ncbi:hypothetical protein EDB85DRAFT_1870760 [Lactarius pseudohatsudake]|nr:hypothetical protein EDB85DRAFT_1870760 [Lactarius pseudohatsudake]